MIPANQPAKIEPKAQKKWLMWSLIGFTGILLVTAVILFWQLKQPVSPAVPSPKPRASVAPKEVQVEEAETEKVCEVNFSITKLKCEEITISPNNTTVSGKEKRSLEAKVTGGSGTYKHKWSVISDGSDKGGLSSTTTNPTDWTAPANLKEVQGWTIKDVITDTSVTTQTAACEVNLKYSGLVACFETCDEDSDCESDLRCMTVGGEKRCVNPSCTEETDCACASPGPSPSPSPKASVKPSPSPEEEGEAEVPVVSPPSGELAEQPTLPEAGVNTPVILGVSAGILLMILGLLF